MTSELPGSYLYTFAALTALVALLVGVLIIALWRFGVAAREARRPARDEPSEAVFVTQAVQDALTRLRAQERALQERAEHSERLSDSIVAGITSGLLVVDPQGRVRTVNPAARRLLGIGDVAPDADMRALLSTAEPLAQVIEEGLRHAAPIARRLVSVRAAAPGGSALVERHLGVTVSPLVQPGGTLLGVICLFTDLTQVIALEEQVRLKDSLARLGELTAGLAHELRNGLATVHGYARLLDPEALGPPHDAYVRALREETESLGDVVTNFLNFARPVRLAVAPVVLDRLVARVVEDLRPEARKHGGAITVAGPFGVADGDDVLLRQAIGNLVRNAVEACVEAGITPNVRVDGGADVAGGTVFVRIVDNGPGLPGEDVDRLFQPFFTTKASGTGLGLSIVQKIAVTHNGQVVPSNLPGGGASFELRLPASAATVVGSAT